jgi:antitoxin VapB
MALNIKSPEADELARALSQMTGRSITGAVLYALSEQIRREKGRVSTTTLAEDLMEIGRDCAALPNLDTRTDDEILGYNSAGVW